MKNILILLSFFLITTKYAFADIYTIPKEIAELTRTLIENHNTLKKNIIKDYQKLLKIKKPTISQLSEMKAYKTIIEEHLMDLDTALLIDIK